MAVLEKEVKSVYDLDKSLVDDSAKILTSLKIDIDEEEDFEGLPVGDLLDAGIDDDECYLAKLINIFLAYIPYMGLL